MVGLIQESPELLTRLIFVGSFCQSANVRSYVPPFFDSAVLSSAEKQMEPYLASITDAQRALGIGRTTAYRLIDAGKLETVKIGRRTLIKIASIKALAGEAQHCRQSDPE